MNGKSNHNMKLTRVYIRYNNMNFMYIYIYIYIAMSHTLIKPYEYNFFNVVIKTFSYPL
jgi:hypothetical protein